MGTPEDHLSWAHPVVREWFTTRFGTPTEPQIAGWPHILAHRNTLISAPTGSGKTLAAFLACIDSLVRQSLAGNLPKRTQVLYISPLKALVNDVQKNLDQPLFEIQQLAAERGYLMPAIRTVVRTGDTPIRDRARMLKLPPHILVTTPESLYILLTAARSRETLRHIHTVIVDEIHALANNKRGAHLALSLERLDAITHQRPNRIGLSATQRPLSLVAEFLSGQSENSRRQPEQHDHPEWKGHPERSEGPPQSSNLPRRSKLFNQQSIVSSTSSDTSTYVDTCRAHSSPSFGLEWGSSRKGEITTVVIPSTRSLDLAIELPSSELGPIASNEMWEEIYQRLEQLALEHRSTLVFVNTRRLVERISHHLSERIGEEHVAAHHGSLSRHLRLESERRLKQGECRILIATASLELGIDIGNVDLVCQIGSPRAIAVALQRVGRAGHWRGAIPKGRFFATTRDELVECAAIIRAIRQGDLDQLILPEAPLDILAQQIVAACAADEWNEDELFALVRRARNYRDLSRETFDKILVMLSEGISAKRGRFGAYLYRDQINHRLRARRGSRLAAITSGGAIPETALYNVVALPEETVIGTLDEDFAIESNAGDIMLLGNTSWRIRRVESRSGRVLVEDAHGQPPTIPFWRGEAPARTFDLSTHVGELRRIISEQCSSDSAVSSDLACSPASECSSDLECHPEQSEGPQQSSNMQRGSKLSNQPGRNCCPDPKAGGPYLPAVGKCGDDSSTRPDDLQFLDPESHRQLTAYITEGRTVLGAVPTQSTVIAERFFDEGGGMQLVIHAPFGARINRAWGLALRKRFCRSFNFELQASATDDGINIALAEQHSFPLADVFHFLQPETVEDILQQAVLTGSPIFATRFRWDANRSLALLRFQNGKKVPPYIQRMRNDDLLAAVFPDVAACFENIEGDIKIPDHPLVEEVMKDVMHEAMDIDGLRRVLEAIRDGSIRTVAVDTPVPSQFAHEILNANPYAFLDDAPLEERRARAVQLRRTLPASVLEESGKLNPAAIAQVIEESRPDLRDSDDLHDLLQTLILYPANTSISIDPACHPERSEVNECTSKQSCHPERSTGLQNSSNLPNRSTLFNQQSILPPAHTSTLIDRSTLKNFPSQPEHLTQWMRQLVETHRAVFAFVGDHEFWVASEKTKDFASIYIDVSFSPNPPELPSSTSTPEAVLDRALLGWMQHIGPLTTQELSNLLSVGDDANPSEPLSAIDAEVTPTSETIIQKTNRIHPSPASLNASLLRLEATGAILRGHFRSTSGTIEWCDRRLLARIHRLTVATLRKQIEPVTAAQFMHWLLRWQHLAPGTSLRGEHGLLEALRQLQGFEIPASAWERHVLARRVADYDGATLDHLCLMGVAGWGRLSPHPATLDDATGRTRRIVPTSVAPITFFLREECDWMQSRAHDNVPEPGLSASAQLLLDALRRHGALFFTDLLRITALDRLEVEHGLWELVAAGFVTADGFDNLRGLISKAHPAAISFRGKRPRHTAGRWSLLWNANGVADEIASDTPGRAANKANESVPFTPERIEATCWMLLRRYGILFRELLARESNLPPWRELQLAFRRLENRDEVRGGRFVSGFVGEQFALPIAVESVRQVRNLPASNELITISAADPLNLVGIIVPGERIPAIGPRTVSFRAGAYVAETAPPQIAIIIPNDDPDASAPGREAAV